MPFSDLPPRLEKLCVKDEIFAAAYAAVSDVRRGALKLVIARLAALYGARCVEEQSSRRKMRQGFNYLEQTRPADWVIICWDERCQSPARILAALLPPILAQVTQILTLRVSSAPGSIPEGVLLALELAGQETLIDCTEAEALRILNYAAASQKSGRLLCLGQVPELRDFAAEHEIPCWSRTKAPRIGLLPAAAALLEAPDYGCLRFAQPDAELVVLPAEAMPEAGGFDALICGPAKLAREEEAWLTQSPFALCIKDAAGGHEACWIWPDLPLEFFLQRHLALVQSL